MHEKRWTAGEEMYEVCWQPGSFPASALATKKPKAAEPSRPAAVKAAYRYANIFITFINKVEMYYVC